MSRDITEAVETELAAKEVRTVIFFEGVFGSSTIRLWSGYGEIVWDSKSWFGAGTLLGVSDITETNDLRATTVTLSLNGVSQEVKAMVLLHAKINRLGKIWFGFREPTGEIIASPALAFVGLLDVPSYTDEADKCIVSVSYENQLAELNRTREFRWTHEMQLSLHPNSYGFQYQAQQLDAKIVF